jgi:mono/diheme cytochrome c family protein
MKGARYRVACVAGSAVLSLMCTSAGAQTIRQGTARSVQSLEGVDSYKAYCAVCHGAAAKGDGPAATALKKVPADLTGIAKRHNGNFSAAEVEEVILGKNMSVSHGTREMPMWGPIFNDIAPDRTFAKLRVANLINYLKSIQTQ